jgi:enoyl-CoA hydratase/carnithine racemase
VRAPDYAAYEFIAVDVADNGVATVTLNRPESKNAVHGPLHEELQHIWLDLANDYDVKVVVLTGAGDKFCVGGDVKAMAGSDETFGSGRNIDRRVVTANEARRTIAYLLDLEQPVIAAINGDAVGLGATLALCCDITVAADSARIGDPHVNVGLVAGDGGAMIWPLLVGPNRAKEFLLRGNLLRGAEAERIGLVNYAVPADEVMAKAMELADELAAKPPMAVRWTKLTVNRWLKDVYQHTFDVGIAFEQITITSDDHKEAARAFAERRPGTFTGH